ncbi:MAG: HD domain-containing protein [Candidatus Saccharimonadales bacterium]
MQTLERHLNELPIVDYVGQQNYDDLLHDAHILAKENHVDEMLQSSTFELLEEMRVYDEDIAIGGLRTLPVALSTASEIGLFYDIDIDRGSIFASSLLHDVGKMALPKELLVKSTIGQEWTTADTLTMRQHIYTGGMILRNRCLPVTVIRSVEEHHHKQTGGNEYGIDAHLNNEERICRDAVAIADFAEADINRTNTRNQDLSRAQREQEICKDIRYVLGDYSYCDELSRVVAGQILGYTSTSLLLAG